MTPTVADLVEHVEHIVQMVGVDHVGIGFNLCSIFTDFLAMEKSIAAADVIRNTVGLWLYGRPAVSEIPG